MIDMSFRYISNISFHNKAAPVVSLLSMTLCQPFLRLLSPHLFILLVAAIDILVYILILVSIPSPGHNIKSTLSAAVPYPKTLALASQIEPRRNETDKTARFQRHTGASCTLLKYT